MTDMADLSWEEVSGQAAGGKIRAADEPVVPAPKATASPASLSWEEVAGKKAPEPTDAESAVASLKSISGKEFMESNLFTNLGAWAVKKVTGQKTQGTFELGPEGKKLTGEEDIPWYKHPGKFIESATKRPLTTLVELGKGILYEPELLGLGAIKGTASLGRVAQAVERGAKGAVLGGGIIGATSVAQQVVKKDEISGDEAGGAALTGAVMGGPLAALVGRYRRPAEKAREPLFDEWVEGKEPAPRMPEDPVPRSAEFDKQATAESKAYDLMKAGASLKTVEAIRRRDPYLGQVLDGMMERRRMAQESMGETRQGEVLGPEGPGMATPRGQLSEPAARQAETLRQLPYKEQARLLQEGKIDAELLQWLGIGAVGATGVGMVVENMQRTGRGLWDVLKDPRGGGAAAPQPREDEPQTTPEGTMLAGLGLLGAVTLGRSKLHQTPKFKEWFGKSVAKDVEGVPEQWYHGSAQDISEFKPKQAGAIFLTKDPEFAGHFADTSKRWMERHGDASGAKTLYPLYVRAEKVFDADIPAHRETFSRWLEKEGISDAEVRKQFASTGEAELRYDNKADLLSGMERGSWAAIEHPLVQQFIRKNGYDSFHVWEDGNKNLAVLDPNQVKSAVGNSGEFSRKAANITAGTVAGGIAADYVLNPEGREERLKQLGLLGGAFLAVKAKGGAWHPEAVERLAKPLKYTLIDARPHTDAARVQLTRELGRSPDAQDLIAAVQARYKPIEQWVDSRIKDYLNKHAGTATDPLKDVEIPSQHFVPDEQSGGVGRNTARWEEITDKAFYDAHSKYPNQMEWHIARNNAANDLSSYLSHVGDYLREHVPPEKLQQYDLVRAVKETAKWDAELAKKMNSVEGRLEGTVAHKKYDDGFQWVEVKSPEALKREGDIMGHCVGGYCDYVESGESKIYSLRDKKGMSHVTVEVAPGGQSIRGRDPQAPWAKENLDSITQIKGKQNRAPVAEYLPHVRDFVKSGKWGKVEDLENAGLIDLHTPRIAADPAVTAAFGEERYVPKEEFYKRMGPKNQAGSVSPELLTKLGLGAAGAMAGMALTYDKAEGALVGSIIGLGAALAGRNAVQLADKTLGLLSTRISNISVPIGRRMVDHEMYLARNTHRELEKAHPFFEAMAKQRGPDAEALNRALLTNDAGKIKALIAKIGDPALDAAWKEVRGVLDGLGQQLKATGRLDNLLEGYFPRVVIDREGLLAELGGAARTRLEELLLRAEQKSIKAHGEGLSAIEESQIINKHLRNLYEGTGQPGMTKRRSIEEVTERLAPFYASPLDSLNAYIHSAVADVEKAKFFGKDIAWTRKEGRSDLELDTSIGNVVRKELEAKNIDSAQALELTKLIKTRFGTEGRGTSPLVQDFKNLSNMGLLANVVSAGTQLGDTATAVYLNGLRPALTAVVQKFSGRLPLSVDDFGLAHKIAEEFTSTRPTALALNQMFKYGLFSAVDRLGKDIALGSTWAKYRGLARTEKGRAKITEEFGAAYGEELPQLLSDLQNGKRTDLTDSLVFGKLSNVQPISKLEMPQSYLEMPNGRVLYMLKSFMLKQVDIVRRDAYNELAKGTKEGVKTGIGNLTKYALALGAGGIATDVVKDFILGKPIDPKFSDGFDNVMKTFGWSSYAVDKAKSGKPVEAVLNTAIPPYKMWDDLVRRDPRAVQYIPVVGKLIYSHLMGGKELAIAAERKREAQKEKEAAMTEADRALAKQRKAEKRERLIEAGRM